VDLARARSSIRRLSFCRLAQLQPASSLHGGLTWCAHLPFDALLGRRSDRLAERDVDEFEEFVRTARPRLFRAFAGGRGRDAGEAVAEALGWAWEHWDDLVGIENPVGYLYRVGQSRTRSRRAPALPPPSTIGIPEVEPALIPAVLRLPESQRTAVWLVHACGWSYAEVAQAMNTTTSTVGNHVSRALARLRRDLEVETRA
jgi:RNA polymerase sigma-70 factor (ECF subfamily)